MSVLALPIFKLTAIDCTPRKHINPDVVTEYAVAMLDGREFPPVEVFADANSVCWLADGYYRVAAAREAGQDHILCNIRQGTQADAQWFAYAANQDAGSKPRTSHDKHHLVNSAIRHPNARTMSSRALARYMGISHPMIADARRVLYGDDYPPEQTRIGYTRNGFTYSMTPHARTVSPVEPRLQADASIPASIPRDRVWAAQELKAFTKEILRLLRSYEKTHAPVDAIAVVRRQDGTPTSIEIVYQKENVA